MLFKKRILLIFLLIIASTYTFSQIPPRSGWMSGGYGLMVHWLAPPYKKQPDQKPDGPFPIKGEYVWDLNTAVDSFDLGQFIADFDATGADWLIFTIGQNTGTYASPNTVIDSLAGLGHTSNRDLLLEIAKEVKKRGKKFIAYLPCEIRKNYTLLDGFGWLDEPGTDQAKFQGLYTKAIKEWAIRFGDNLDGWWFDGCYSNHPSFDNKYMNWEIWYQVARAGNKNAILTFNDGSFLGGITRPIRPEHDYTSGEALVLVDGKIRLTTKPNGDLFMPEKAYVDNTECLYHVLLPIDGYWWHNLKKFPDWANVPFDFSPGDDPSKMPSPIYPDQDIIRFVADFTAVGGAVTLNANISQEGYFSQKTISQLRNLRNALDNNK